MNKNTTNRKIGRFHVTEYWAYNYLQKKGISIDLRKKNLIGSGDLISFDGKQYEVKRVRASMSQGNIRLQTYFTKHQRNKFPDDCIILFFKSYKKIPEKILTYSQIKKFITPSGHLSYNRIMYLEGIVI